MTKNFLPTSILAGSGAPTFDRCGAAASLARYLWNELVNFTLIMIKIFKLYP